jgi:methenyltetrahydromethanopterin cyclohydrolase
MLSINAQSAEIVQRMIAQADALGVTTHQLSNGATVVDAGVQLPGSLEAGRLFAEVCLGGLGQVQFCHVALDQLQIPGVTVAVSYPTIACMASQYAGWAIYEDPFFAMGSGPARALYHKEELFDQISYRDRSDVAVFALEGSTLPTAEIADKVAQKCGVAPDHLYLLIAPTASLVGSVQVAARVVETGLHKMHKLGFDINTIIAGIGACPLASIAADDLRAIGRTNDAVLYGGRAWYTVQTDDAQIEAVIEQLPSSASRDYGTPFYDLFQRYEGDFYQIDPLLFSPAELFINNVASGRTFHAGQINADMVREALLSPDDTRGQAPDDTRGQAPDDTRGQA